MAGVVVIRGDVLLEVGVLHEGVERQLVVDPDALPAVERPQLPEVVVGEVVVDVVVVDPADDGVLGKEAVGVGPLEEVLVVEAALVLAVHEHEVLVGHALGEAVGQKCLEAVVLKCHNRAP